MGAMDPSLGPRGVEGRGGHQTPTAPPARRVSRASGRRSVVVLAQQQRAEGPSRRQQLAGLAALAAALAARPAQAGLFDGGKAERERYEKDTVRPQGTMQCCVRCQRLPDMPCKARDAIRRRSRPLPCCGPCTAVPIPSPCQSIQHPVPTGMRSLPGALPAPQAQIITNVRNAATLERDAPGREETMAGVRKEINDWVARYRR